MGKGVQTAVDNVNEKIADALQGMDGTDQAGIDAAMMELDGTAEQEESGCQCDPERFPGDRSCGGPSDRPASLSIPGWCRCPIAARSDDEHHQWWRACRQLRRCPRVHGHAARLRTIQRCLRAGTEIFHNLKKVLIGQGIQHGRRRRRGFRTGLEEQPGSAGRDHASDRSGRLQSGRTDLDRPGCGIDRVLRQRNRQVLDRRKATFRRRDGRFLGGLVRTSTRSAVSKMGVPRMTGKLEKVD